MTEEAAQELGDRKRGGIEQYRGEDHRQPEHHTKAVIEAKPE